MPNTSRASLKARGDDLYETPPAAVRALLAAETLPTKVWEPACGPGNIVTELRRAGHNVIATDLVDYNCPGQQAGVDFLMERQAPINCNCIVTNPPFKLAAEFVEHAIGTLGIRYVAMLLRLAFLESERRSWVLDTGLLARIHVFRKRLPMMHRAGWDGPKASSSIAFAWFVWDSQHQAEITLSRLSWEPFQ